MKYSIRRACAKKIFAEWVECNGIYFLGVSRRDYLSWSDRGLTIVPSKLIIFTKTLRKRNKHKKLFIISNRTKNVGMMRMPSNVLMMKYNEIFPSLK